MTWLFKISVWVKGMYLLLSHIILKNCYCIELLPHKVSDKRHKIKSPLVLLWDTEIIHTTKCPFIFILAGIFLEQMRKPDTPLGPGLLEDICSSLYRQPHTGSRVVRSMSSPFSPLSTGSIPSSPTWSECEEVYAGSSIKTSRFSCF